MAGKSAISKSGLTDAYKATTNSMYKGDKEGTFTNWVKRHMYVISGHKPGSIYDLGAKIEGLDQLAKPFTDIAEAFAVDSLFGTRMISANAESIQQFTGGLDTLLMDQLARAKGIDLQGLQKNLGDAKKTAGEDLGKYWKNYKDARVGQAS